MVFWYIRKERGNCAFRDSLNLADCPICQKMVFSIISYQPNTIEPSFWLNYRLSVVGFFVKYETLGGYCDRLLLS